MRRAAHAFRVLLLLLACLASACESEATPTQPLVVVDSDLTVGRDETDALRTIQIAVLRSDSDLEIVPARPLIVSVTPTSPLEFKLPLSFALTPQGGDEGAQFRVVVTGQNELGEDIAERQVITGFRKGASLRLDMFLASTCLRELCREQNRRTTLTCDVRRGGCGQAPELRDLPAVGGGTVGGYARAEDGAVISEDDAGARKCARDVECDDGLYCNGVEACDPGSVKANALGCVAGPVPSCGASETCDEASDRCTACAQNADGDGDHVSAKACGGSDCNDGDPAIAPGKEEVCDGKDNDCDERTNVVSAGSVCSVAMGGSDAGVDGGAPDPGVRDAGAEGGTAASDAGADAGRLDAGAMEAGAMEAGPAEAGAPDANVPLTSGCRMGSTAACSSFINAWNVEVPMGSLGAVMEPNVGQGFEATVNASDTTKDCTDFLAILGTDPALARSQELGSLNLTLHTVYRPARWATGVKYPLVVWGNGTCMQPETYGGLLRSLASEGFIVVAPNSRYVGTGDAMVKAWHLRWRQTQTKRVHSTVASTLRGSAPWATRKEAGRLPRSPMTTGYAPWPC